MKPAGEDAALDRFTVSVIIPTRDRAELLGRTVQSVFEQTRPPDEIIVVDDASPVPADTFLERLSLPEGVNLRYCRLEEPSGGSAARNRGAALARGAILMFLDDDDTWLPRKIENQLRIFEQRPEVGLVYAGRAVVDEHGALLFTVVPTAAGNVFRQVLQKNYIGITSAVAVRQELFHAAGGFDPEMPARQDYDLWVRLCKMTAVAFDPALTVRWLVHREPRKQLSGNPHRYEQAVKRFFVKYRADYAGLSWAERRKAYATQYVLLADKYAQAGSPRQYLFALRSLGLYPTPAGLSRLLPYPLWLRLRRLLQGRGKSDGGYGKLERAAAGLLEALPGVKPVVKRAYQRLNYFFYRERGFRFALHPGVRLLTPAEWAGSEGGDGTASREELFFGYYDKSPWSPDGTRFLCHRLVPPNLAGPAGGAPGTAAPEVEIMLYDRAAHRTRVLGRTAAWNLQQGAMLQWLPGSGGRTIIFNDRVGGKLAARMITLPAVEQSGSNDPPPFAGEGAASSSRRDGGAAERTIPWPVQAIHPAGREALTLNYRRLAVLRPEYGYTLAAENFEPDRPPAEDGIWRVDLHTGRGELILSLERLIAAAPRPEMEKTRHKVNHLLYSPAGGRFAFVYRRLGPRGKFSRLYTAAADGSALCLQLDQRMVSHYCWRDEEHLLVWGRAPENGDCYYLINVLTGARAAVGAGVLDRYGDGHPSFSPDGRWLLTDSYPDRRRQCRLLLYRPQTGVLCEAGRLLAPWIFDGPRRCDLHPRWNRSPGGAGLVSFDSVHCGRRGTYILDLRSLVDETAP